MLMLVKGVSSCTQLLATQVKCINRGVAMEVTDCTCYLSSKPVLRERGGLKVSRVCSCITYTFLCPWKKFS